MRSLLREPLLHFLVIGAALFGLYGLVGKKEAEPAKIVVSAERVANLADRFARTWRRPPTQEELDGLVEDDIRDEVFYREGRAAGLDRDDVVIRRRVRQKMEFLAEDMAAGGGERRTARGLSGAPRGTVSHRGPADVPPRLSQRDPARRGLGRRREGDRGDPCRRGDPGR